MLLHMHWISVFYNINPLKCSLETTLAYASRYLPKQFLDMIWELAQVMCQFQQNICKQYLLMHKDVLNNVGFF